MKVINAVGTESETYSEIDILSDLDVSDKAASKIKAEVGEFLVEQILEAVASSRSPVSGESWPALSKEYAREKKLLGGIPKPNMELSGDMLQELTYKKTPDGIKIGFFSKSEAGKADGHNNFSGDSMLAEVGKQRRFLPGEGQEFKNHIEAGVKDIIAQYSVSDDRFKKSDFEGIESKQELWGVLKEMFPNLTRAEIAASIMTNDAVYEFLDELDLLDYLL